MAPWFSSFVSLFLGPFLCVLCSGAVFSDKNILWFTSRNDHKMITPVFGVSQITAVIPHPNPYVPSMGVDEQFGKSLHNLSTRLFELMSQPNDEATIEDLQKLEKESFEVFKRPELLKHYEPLQCDDALIRRLKTALYVIFPNLRARGLSHDELLRYFAYFHQQFYFSPWKIYWHVMNASPSHQPPNLVEFGRSSHEHDHVCEHEFGGRLEHLVLSHGYSTYLVQDAIKRDGLFSWVGEESHVRLCGDLFTLVVRNNKAYALPLKYQFLLSKDLVMAEFEPSGGRKQTINCLITSLYLLVLEQPHSFVKEHKDAANAVLLLASKHNLLDNENYVFVREILVAVKKHLHPAIVSLIDTNNELNGIQEGIIFCGSRGIIGFDATNDDTANNVRFQVVPPKLRFGDGPNSRMVWPVFADDSVMAFIPTDRVFHYLGKFDTVFEMNLYDLAGQFFDALIDESYFLSQRLILLEQSSLETFKKNAEFCVPCNEGVMIHSAKRLKDALSVVFPQLSLKTIDKFYLKHFKYHSGTFYISFISIFYEIAPNSVVDLRPLNGKLDVQIPSVRADYYSSFGFESYVDFVVTQRGLTREVEQSAATRSMLFDCVPSDKHHALMNSLFKTTDYFGDVLVVPLNYYQLKNSNSMKKEFDSMGNKNQFVQSMLVLLSSEMKYRHFSLNWKHSLNALFLLIAENDLFKVETFDGFEFSLFEALLHVEHKVLSRFEPGKIIDTLQAFVRKRSKNVVMPVEMQQTNCQIRLPILNNAEFVHACLIYLNSFRRNRQ